MLKATVKYINFHFKTPGGTSRGILQNKESWFLILEDSITNTTGIGECSIIRGLSPDSPQLINSKLDKLCQLINSQSEISSTFFKFFPAIHFAYEMAMLDLVNGGKRILFQNDFISGKGIPINGLIWMGPKEFMLKQIKHKIKDGFKCLKLKIGALDFQEELDVLAHIRSEFNTDDIQLRVDANGGFQIKDALEKIKLLSQYDIHSIEQPIETKQWDAMAKLVEESPLDIALDEELIGVEPEHIEMMLSTIKSNYIILKPSLLGGFKSSDHWIKLANKHNIEWWVTSALESNIGLNAIAQWTFAQSNKMYQGLGTGQLYTNNIVSPLDIINAHLVHTKYDWELDQILN